MDDIKRIGNNGIVLMMFFAIIYSLIGYFGADLYISIFNSDSVNVVNYSTDYVAIDSVVNSLQYHSP